MSSITIVTDKMRKIGNDDDDSKSEEQEQPYDPFSLFEYDNRKIALLALQRINDKTQKAVNVAPLTTKSDSKSTTSSTSSTPRSRSSKRRASISSSTPSSTPRSNPSRKSPRREHQSLLIPSSLSRNRSSSSSIKRSSSSSSFRSSDRSSSRNAFKRSNSDSQGCTLSSANSGRPLSASSKRRVSIVSGDSTQEGDFLLRDESTKQKVLTNPTATTTTVLTPTSEVLKALTDIQFEQALKQSMRGMKQVNLNDEEQVDLVAELLSETLLKKDGLRLSKKKNNKKSTTAQFSQTSEPNLLNTKLQSQGQTNRTISSTFEKHFDFRHNFKSVPTISSQPNQPGSTSIGRINPNVQLVREFKKSVKDHDSDDEECKLISEPFITIQNDRMNFYPNEPSNITEVVKGRRRNSPVSITDSTVNSKPIMSSHQSDYSSNNHDGQSENVQQQPITSNPRKCQQKENFGTGVRLANSDYDSSQKIDQFINTDDPNTIILDQKTTNELVERAKREGQDEIVRLYINSKLLERSKKQQSRKQHGKSKLSSLSYQFPNLYRQIQTQLKLKRLEQMDPYNQPMNTLIQDMKSLIERC